MRGKISKDNITISVILIVVLSLMFAILFLDTEKSEVHAAMVDGEMYVEEPDSESQNDEEMVHNSIYFPQYENVTMEHNSDFIPILLYNPIDNPCKFKFYTIIEGQEDVLFESEWIEPGHRIQGIALNEHLKQGEYSIQFYISTKSLETKAKMNSGMICTKLIVQ